MKAIRISLFFTHLSNVFRQKLNLNIYVVAVNRCGKRKIIHMLCRFSHFRQRNKKKNENENLQYLFALNAYTYIYIYMLCTFMN